MIAFTNEEIYTLYENEDEVIYEVLNGMSENDILEMVDDWSKHDFIKTYDACDWVRNYLTYR